MRPPFKPTVGRPEDTFHFDPEFTSRTPTGTSTKHSNDLNTQWLLEMMRPQILIWALQEPHPDQV